MDKLLIIFAFAIVIFSACSLPETSKKIDTVTSFYKSLNKQELEKIPNLLHDSISVGSGDYWTHYSKSSYQNWLQWDVVFKPTYEIIDINQNEEIVTVEVSKSCKRILFLH